MSFELPLTLVAAVAQHGPPARRRWLKALPDVVHDLAQQWSLREVGPPVQPGGHCSWVAPARDVDGRDLILKVGWRQTESLHEADALQVWNGDGAVVLHAAWHGVETNALLLERCVPGRALKELVPEPEQDFVVAGLMHRLWREPERGHPFRSLQGMCDAWADEFEQKLAARPGAIDPGLARDAMAMFRSLPATAERNVLLCTDLHAENILAAQREPWLVIDPKPYVGDPTYDPLQHMLNCEGRLLADPLSLAQRLADLLHLEADRLTQWLFARCVPEGLDRPALIEVATRLRVH